MEQEELIQNILINEDLFSDNIDKYATKDLEYINVPDAVGIATEYENNIKRYIIYINNETGTSMYERTLNSFTKAVIFAREMYEGITAYYDNLANPTRKNQKK